MDQSIYISQYSPIFYNFPFNYGPMFGLSYPNYLHVRSLFGSKYLYLTIFPNIIQLPFQYGPMFGLSYPNHLHMRSLFRSKCLYFIIIPNINVRITWSYISKSLKMPKKSQINEYSVLSEIAMLAEIGMCTLIATRGLNRSPAIISWSVCTIPRQVLNPISTWFNRWELY